MHFLTLQVCQVKGLAADPPNSPHGSEKSGSAGRDSGLREKTINWEKIRGSAAKHLTGPTHGHEEGGQKGRTEVRVTHLLPGGGDGDGGR